MRVLVGRWVAVAAAVAIVFGVAPTAAATAGRRPAAQLHIVNYYPANAAWTRMWTAYSHQRTAADFAAIRSLGANAVRLIVQPAAVGYPVVAPQMRARFVDALNTARHAGLSVQLTLFDWWNSYSDLAGSQQWVRSLLGAQAGNRTIALVELQNELPRTSVPAVSWAQQMLPFLRTVLPGVPRTVSASARSGVQGLVSLVYDFPRSSLDVVDVHYYGDPSTASTTFAAAKAVAAGRPVIVGETGRATTSAGDAEAQAHFYRVMALVSAASHMPPPAPWTLSDFTTTGPPHQIAPKEYHFGLRRTNGTWKPAAAVVRAAFAASTVADWDGGFERERNAPADLGSWTRFDVADGRAVVEHQVRRSGRNAVCFSGTRSSASAVPSVMQALPVLHSGRDVTASAWVRRSHGAGSERVSLAWFAADGRYLGQVQSPPATGNNHWQRLAVHGRPLPGAVKVSIHLKAADESGLACYDDATITI